MAKRFLFRRESFGGMILDRDTGLELMLNHTAFLISRLYIDNNFNKDDIILYIRENYVVESKRDLFVEIDAVLDDVLKYFASKTGINIKWNSEYCPITHEDPLSSPISVFWEITSECNLKCLHCYNSSGYKSIDELNTRECIALMNELADIGVLNLIIGGGEPFYRKDFLQILNLADDLGFKTLVATNGTLLSPKISSSLAKLSRLSLALSIHNHIPEKHDQFCGIKGTFDKVLRSINNLNANGIKFGVQTMITKENQYNIPEFMDFIISIGASSWNLKTRVNIGREKINQACLTEGNIYSLEEIIKNLKNNNSDRISIQSSFPMKPTVNKNYKYVEPRNLKLNCGPGIRNCGILPNGYLVACSFLRGKAWSSENSVRDVKFSKLWNDSRIFEPFRNLYSNQLGICNNCSLLGNGCNGGCRARAYNDFGDFYHRDHQCHLEL